MISRVNFRLFMSTLIEMVSEADAGEEFNKAIETLIISAYEINNPETGRVEEIDITGDLIESMGRNWETFAKVGITEVAFVRYFLEGELVCEAGRMLGSGKGAVAIQELENLPDPVMRSFAKAMTLAMRKHDIQILKSMLEGDFDAKGAAAGDNLGLNALINRFLEEEVEETVAKFSSQLDAVFGVQSITDPWPAPKGGERSDDPFPL